MAHTVALKTDSIWEWDLTWWWRTRCFPWCDCWIAKEWQECRNPKAGLKPFCYSLIIFQESHTGHPCPTLDMGTALLLPSAGPASLFFREFIPAVSSFFSLWPFFASGWLWKLPVSAAAALYITTWTSLSCLVHLSTLGGVQPLLQELLPHRTRSTTGTEQRPQGSELTGERSIHTHTPVNG